MENQQIRLSSEELFQHAGTTPKELYDVWIYFHTLIEETGLSVIEAAKQLQENFNPSIVFVLIVLGLEEIDTSVNHLYLKERA